MTRVANIKLGESFDVYVGRPGKGMAGEFGNPHPVDVPCPICHVTHKKGETLPLFRAYFLNRVEQDLEFRQRVLALKGKVLGCFCRPKEGFNGKLLCHAQIIAAWLDGVPEGWIW